MLKSPGRNTFQKVDDMGNNAAYPFHGVYLVYDKVKKAFVRSGKACARLGGIVIRILRHLKNLLKSELTGPFYNEVCVCVCAYVRIYSD